MERSTPKKIIILTKNMKKTMELMTNTNGKRKKHSPHRQRQRNCQKIKKKT